MPRATSFEAFTNAVTDAYARLSPQQRQIAQFVLEHPDEIALGTVTSVAERTGVQPSALVRFANALDLGGFSDMQQVFRSRLLDRSSSYRDRIDALRRSRPTPESGATVLHQFVTEGVTELSQLEDSVSAADLAAAVDRICRATRVHVLAQRRAFPVASYLAYALTRLDVRAQLLDGVGGMLPDALRQIGTDELLLVASFRNYSPEVLAAAEALHGRGVPVIAITDVALSPLRPNADVCFVLGQGASSAFRSLVAPLCLAQALVVSVGHRLVAQQGAAADPTPATPATPSARSSGKASANRRVTRRPPERPTKA